MRRIPPKRLNLLYLAECVSLHSTKGDFVHVKEVVEAFVRKGHSVTLLIRGKKTPLFFKKHLLTFRLPDFRFPFSVFLYLISTLTIAAKVLVRRPTVIYVRDNGVNTGVIISKIFRIPVFLEVNGDLELEYSLHNSILAQVFRILLRNSYSLADVIIIPSRGQLSIIESENTDQKKAYVIPNGVNYYKFRPNDKYACRQRFDLERDCFYFCFVGNLISWQGLDNAIIAFSSLLKENQYSNIKLLIVGVGHAKQELEKLAVKLSVADRIMFLGALPHEQIPDIVNASDVCIAPFTAWRNERIGVSPLKLYEYLSCGKPVIASSLLGTDIIDELDAGILVKPDDTEEMKNAFEKAIKMLPYWEKRANILHEKIAENHSWDCRVNDIVQIMHRDNRKAVL